MFFFWYYYVHAIASSQGFIQDFILEGGKILARTKKVTLDILKYAFYTEISTVHFLNLGPFFCNFNHNLMFHNHSYMLTVVLINFDDYSGGGGGPPTPTPPPPRMNPGSHCDYYVIILLCSRHLNKF